MATLQEIKIELTGLTGLPGLSRLYVDIAGSADVGVNADAVRQWYADNAGYFPANLDVQVAGAGDLLTDTTGAIAGSWSTSPAPTSVAGSGANAAAGGCGACQRWNTSSVSPGNRHIVGRTYLVPLAVGAYDQDGTLTAATISDLVAHAATMLASLSNSLVVWTRPVSGAGGQSHPVTGSGVTDQAARLRTRRQ